MPKSIAELKTYLATLEGGAEYVEGLDSHLGSLRSEAAGHRTGKTAAEGKLGKVLEKLGIDSATEDLEAALEAALKKPAGGTGKGSSETEARLARLEQDLAAEKAGRTRAEEAERFAKASGILKDSLTRGKAVTVNDLAKLLQGDMKFRGDGSPYFVDSNGAEQTVDEYTSAWLKDRPELVQSGAQPGPGGPRGTPKPPPGAKSITAADYRQAVATKNVEILTAIGSGKLTIQQES